MHSQRYSFLLAFFAFLLLSSTVLAQTPTVSLSISNPLSCSQLSATLTAAISCTGAISYRFTGPNDFVLETTTPVVSMTVDGEYTVVASNTATGCTATRSATLTSSLHPDYLPLVDFYRSTNGPGWFDNTGWLTNCEPCSGWNGVWCYNNRVSGLFLVDNLLVGKIPTSIGKLSTMNFIFMGRNRLNGPILLYAIKF